MAFPLSDTNTNVGEILDNINGYIHSSVSGFILKCFAKFDSVVSRDVNAQKAAGAPSPEAFLHWFSNFTALDLNGARGIWHTSCQSASEHESADRSASFFLTRSTTFDSSIGVGWRDVQVVGQFCKDEYTPYRDGLLSLCGHALEVFASQPTRLFLHGIYIRMSLVELWVFDRSGIYSCEAFDIQNDFTRFLSVLLSYRLMTDRDLGRSDIFKNNKFDSSTMLKDADLTSLGQLYLEEQPIALSRELVGEGTTCYRAKTLDSNRWDYVIKFKWRLANDRREEELLKMVKEKNVWGVVSLDYYKEVDSTANLRQGLQYGPYRRFLVGQHRAEGSEEVGVQGKGAKDVVEDTEETNRSFEDRIFTCVVVSPAGRPLRTFKTRLELLQVLRDAVKGHRSLLQEAKLLHQDVSAGNIIIIDAQGKEEPKGIMIDLDVAMDLATGPRTPGEVTGTRPFMAIGILMHRPHTYRHDLESFLYVFLWTIISNRSENPPKTSKLREWSRGSWYESATRKTTDMNKNNFGNILAEFTPEFHSLKPLAETLRQLLFPLEDGAIWTGTDSAPKSVNGLYDAIIGAFEEAITLESRI